jgi:hypothetical protein
MTQPQASRPPFYQTAFGRAIDDAAGRIARALMLTVAAVGLAYVARSAQTWTLFTVGIVGTVVAWGWVAMQFLLAYSAAKVAIRALPTVWPADLTVSRRVEITLAALIVVPLTLSVVITASKTLENVNQLTLLGGGQ